MEGLRVKIFQVSLLLILPCASIDQDWRWEGLFLSFSPWYFSLEQATSSWTSSKVESSGGLTISWCRWRWRGFNNYWTKISSLWDMTRASEKLLVEFVCWRRELRTGQLAFLEYSEESSSRFSSRLNISHQFALTWCHYIVGGLRKYVEMMWGIYLNIFKMSRKKRNSSWPLFLLS